MEWSWTTWVVSVLAVVVSGAAAWLEGNWVKRTGLAMGFANHGGMWDDLILLPIANAAIVPHLTVGGWLAPALAARDGCVDRRARPLVSRASCAAFPRAHVAIAAARLVVPRSLDGRLAARRRT